MKTVIDGEDFCFCGDEISLQIVSGGGAPEGLYGKVTLKVNGDYIDYVRADEITKLRAGLTKMRLNADMQREWPLQGDELEAANEKVAVLKDALQSTTGVCQAFATQSHSARMAADDGNKALDGIPSDYLATRDARIRDEVLEEVAAMFDAQDNYYAYNNDGEIIGHAEGLVRAMKGAKP